MNFLFYINPLVVRGNPTFYNGAITKKLIPQARILANSGHSITFVVNEFEADQIANLMPQAGVVRISQRELFSVLGSTSNIEGLLYKNASSSIRTCMKNLIEKSAPKNIDVVIAWETPANLFRDLYPEAKVVHEMPGFLSRVPFPELYTLDVEGLFHESMLTNQINKIREFPVDPRAKSLIRSIRAEILSFISANNPFSRSKLDPLGRFKQLILLPLQITDQYAFLADSDYSSQTSLLIDVLASTPIDIGVVVTQYASSSSMEKVLDAEKYQQLKAVYPNLIFNQDFDRLDNVSQYILAAVDAVITVSSSIGVQGLLWNKPLIALGNSHLKCISSFDSIEDYSIAIANGGVVTVDCDDVLAWVLTYQQPLASVVLQDKDFLERWLLAIPSNGEITALPNFFDIKPNYGREFILRAKCDRARELLAGVFKERDATLLERDFQKNIKEIQPVIISFDIFDTLVDRSLEQPVHLFRMIEADVDLITQGRISNFQVARQTIERSLRQKILKSGESQEITLEEIYDEMMVRYALSEQERNSIRDLEVKEELHVLRRREAGWRLYKAAVDTGARVVLISDMYLPESVIREVLINSGYPAELPLYLSSSIGLRKHEGDLFAHVKSVEGVEFSRWLHVGDNPHGDGEIPRSFGISTYLIKSAYQLFGANEKFADILKSDRRIRSKGEAAVYGLIQRRYFDDPHQVYPKNTHFGGDPFILGYVGMGPVFFGFLHWVMTQAKRDGIEKLIFLSRDGKVLWRMAQELFPESDGWPAIGYAMSSRRAARVASLFTVGDISQLIDSSLSTTTLDELFRKKLGVELLGGDEELIRSFGFSDRNSKVGADHREPLRQLAMALSDRILNNAAFERELLADHYRSLGVLPGSRIGLVDIGYAGTMQAAVERITGVSDVAGYYYITFETALLLSHRTGAMRGYAGEFVKPVIHHDPICRNGFLFETLFCSSDASFVCFRQTPAGLVEPCFDINHRDGVRRHVVEKAHDAAVALARDIRAAFGHRIAELPLSAATASRVLNDFIFSPSGRDAEIFEGCLFDDSFAGSSARFIVPPRNIIERQPDIIKSAIWKEGSTVFSRRPDLFGSRQPTVQKSTQDINKNSIYEINKFKEVDCYSVRNFIFKLERKIIEIIEKNERKLNKYSRDRCAYFMDSKDIVPRFYWGFVGRHLAGGLENSVMSGRKNSQSQINKL